MLKLQWAEKYKESMRIVQNMTDIMMKWNVAQLMKKAREVLANPCLLESYQFVIEPYTSSNHAVTPYQVQSLRSDNFVSLKQKQELFTLEWLSRDLKKLMQPRESGDKISMMRFGFCRIQF